MNQPNYIHKTRSDPEGLEFAALRQEGIRLLQDLCGNNWTDYNLHDPGVTILEQLCYGLTDLIYRTGFDVPDYLTGTDKQIDYEECALYPPHQIFPSGPININDYRKILFDSIVQIDNVWVSAVSAEDSSVRGLYRIDVRLREAVDSDEIIKKIEKVYAAHRNLGEDVKEIRIVDSREYSLHGKIAIDNTRDPAHILAEIYFRCSQYIAPSIMLCPYQELQAEGRNLDNIYTGPLTEHGYIEDHDLSIQPSLVTTTELVGIINQVDGVTSIDSLCLKDGLGRKTEEIVRDTDSHRCLCLLVPQTGEQMTVVLHKNQRQHRIFPDTFRVEYERLYSELQAPRQTREVFENVDALPKGEYRDLEHYFSVRNHFPRVYGIGHFGLLDTAPLARKAEVLQLKGYLLLFEQTMANFLANCSQLRRLYSLDRHRVLQQSYFYQGLSNPEDSDKDTLYDEVDKHIAGVVAQFDRFSDRRNRVLDYLLALYGEKFSQNSLRRFNYYCSTEELEKKLIDNKIALLANLVEIGQRRASGFNYRRTAWDSDNCAGVQKKAAILLGIKDYRTRSLTDELRTRGMTLVSHSELERLGRESGAIGFIEPGEIDESDSDKYREIVFVPCEEEEGMQPPKAIDFFKHGCVSEILLRNGINGERYRLFTSRKDRSYQLLIKVEENGRWWSLASLSSEDDVVEAANSLRKFLIVLNRQSEGIHVVEHLLLRNLKGPAPGVAVADDFYSSTISVVFPSWTAKFSDRQFVKLAEETVRLNCPAHILPWFHWFDFELMNRFEELYKSWLVEKKHCPRGSGEVDSAARSLAEFLIEHQKQ